MSGYDFTTLSPDDFEVLACDLLRARYEIEFKSFRRGPDGGIDLLSNTADGPFIVQCKHYAGSSFSDLRRAARAEKRKMDDKKPNQYLFVTTQDLTLTQQLDLVQDLQPWVQDVRQILARSDLNILLSVNPRIEQKHFKLWLASATVLHSIVRSGLWVRSSALLEEIQDRVQRFVINDGYDRTKAMLDAKGVCVIVGSPGVGKSMIADMLSLIHWHEGWQIVTLESHELSSCWDAWRYDTRQIFYLDDVFGQTDVQERLGRDSGTHLARLIERVGRSQDKRVIITSRLHIIREAQMRDENVERSSLRARECIVQVTDYDQFQKARILYNHLYFSDLNRETVKEFVAGKHYRKVIQHANFTPRLIEQSIRQHSVGDQETSLDARIQAVLDRPVLLWGTSFRESLDELARLILVQVAINPVRGVEINDLKSGLATKGTSLSFTSALKRLEGSWLRIHQIGINDTPLVRFHDPSCRDYLLAFLDSEPDYAINALGHASQIDAASMLLKYCESSNEGGDWTYPLLRSYVDRHRKQVVDAILSAWERTSDRDPCDLLVALGQLHSAQASFDLGISNWIIDNALRISLPHDATPTIEALDLLQAIAEKGVNLGDCAANFTRIVGSLNEILVEGGGDSQWSALHAVVLWAEPQLTNDQIADCYESMAEGFLVWLRSEFDVILDNARNAEEADDWVGDAHVEATRIFGPEKFAYEFGDFETRASEKFDTGFDGASYWAEYGRQAPSGPSLGDRLRDLNLARERSVSPDAAIHELFRPLE